jgi:hypothetical protein
MALEGIGSISPEEEQITETTDLYRTVPVYQIGTQQPTLDSGVRLQDIYGTKAMPMFQFARRVQTGEVEFDPNNQFHQEAANFISQTPDEDLLNQGIDISTKDILVEGGRAATGTLISKAGQLANQTGQPFFDSLVPAGKDLLTFGGGLDIPKGSIALPSATARNLLSTNPEVAAAVTKANIAGEGGKTFAAFSKNKIDQLNELRALQGESAIDTTGAISQPGFFESGFKGYAPGIAQVGTTFGVDLAFNLLSGQKPLKAVKGAAITTAGTAIGTAVGGPIGGFIGGTLAKVFGGRVVCNELHRQGYLTREQVIDDYRFTRDFLSPQLVRGYHIWAIPVVNQLRKGRMVWFWRHLCVHRANEIAYVYGKREKPDYLGKIYRRLLEWPSWTMGLFCKKSDWSVLYKQKEV